MLISQRLGKTAPRRDRRTFRLSKYMPTLPAPFDHVNWLSKPNAIGWPMMLNDTLGDCVCAASGHMVEQWTTYTGVPAILPDADVLAMYEQVGGYVPGDSSTDNGCGMLSALNWWRQTGLAGHKILGYAAVDWNNLSEVKNSIRFLGNLYLGIQLPISAQGQYSWQVPVGGPYGDGSPGSWGGHCIPVVSYDKTGLIVITWGQKFFMTWGFLHTYADEAYAVLSPDWIAATGLAPNQFNLAQLQADLAQL